MRLQNFYRLLGSYKSEGQQCCLMLHMDIYIFTALVDSIGHTLKLDVQSHSITETAINALMF